VSAGGKLDLGGNDDLPKKVPGDITGILAPPKRTPESTTLHKILRRGVSIIFSQL
jgi:hypothetical protein